MRSPRALHDNGAPRPLFRPRRDRGQHFLIRGDVAASMVAALGLRPGDAVLEIGPGTGALTHLLVEAGARVTAIELDHDLADGVRIRFPEVEVIEGDAARIDWPPAPYLLGSLPYSATSPILARLAGANPAPVRAVFMLQREVADRLAAEPGTRAYGRLSAVVRARYAVAILRAVPPSAFRPRPKVHSAVVRLEPLPDAGGWSSGEWGLYTDVVRAAFTQRRKRLPKALLVGAKATGLVLDESRAAGAVCDLGFEGYRPEALSPEAYRALSRALMP